MIPNMAVLPLVKSPGRAQIEKVPILAKESDEMSTPCIVARLEDKSGDSRLHLGSVRIKAAEPNPRGTSHHRMLLLAMVTLLAAAFGFNPAARAQDVPTDSSVQGQVQPVGNNSAQESNSMEAIGLLVTLEARPGKEADAEAFLKSAQPLALNENGTLKWYAIKLGPAKFGIFDTFANEGGRSAHLSGEIAKALGARANELFATSPQIEKVEILASTPLKN